MEDDLEIRLGLTGTWHKSAHVYQRSYLSEPNLLECTLAHQSPLLDTLVLLLWVCCRDTETSATRTTRRPNSLVQRPCCNCPSGSNNACKDQHAPRCSTFPYPLLFVGAGPICTAAELGPFEIVGRDCSNRRSDDLCPRWLHSARR
jgi:hypothetical protein